MMGRNFLIPEDYVDYRKLFVDTKNLEIDDFYFLLFTMAKITIKSNENCEVDVKKISLDMLNEETQKIVIESEKNYREGKMDKFISHEEFWKII